MKFTTAVVATILAAAASAQETTGTTTETTVATVASTTEAPAATYTPTKEMKCQEDECKDASDLACIAKCWGVPSPNTAMVIDTTECAAACPQGNGTKEETDVYAACQQSCISSLFMPTQPTGGAGGSGSNTDASGADATATGSGSGSGSSNGDASSTSGAATAETSTSGAGRFAVPFAGFVGLVGVIFTVAL